MLGRNALVARHDHLAFCVFNVERNGLPLKAFRRKRQLRARLREREAVELEEASKNFFNRVADGLEQNRTGHLAAAVDTEVKNILRIEFEVEPRTAIGNHARGEKQLPRRMGLALIVLEEDAGRAMQLADDDAFRTVDDERALFRHQRNFAHVNIVFTDFLDRAGLGCFAVIDLKTDLGAKAAAIGQAAELAFGHVEFRRVRN